MKTNVLNNKNEKQYHNKPINETETVPNEELV